jgi:hypothetical protein
MNARYYDPSTAQFLTVDPLVNITHTPYSYVDNSPLDGSDPSGLCPDTAPGNQKSKQFQDWSNEDLQKALDDPNTPPALKQAIKTEQKARDVRGHRGDGQKKPSQNKPKKAKKTYFDWNGVFVGIGLVAVVAIVVVSLPADVVVGAAAALASLVSFAF